MSQNPGGWNPQDPSLQGGQGPQIPQSPTYPSQSPQTYPSGSPQAYPPQSPQTYPPQSPQTYPPQSPQTYPSQPQADGFQFPPSPPQANAYQQTHMGPPPSGGQGFGSTPQPPTPTKKRVNTKLILIIGLALLVMAGIGVGAGYLFRNRDDVAGPTITTPTPDVDNPTPESNETPGAGPKSPASTPTRSGGPATGQRITVKDNLTFERPNGWSVKSSDPAKGTVTLQYGQGLAWITVYTGSNTTPWDAPVRCGFIIKNWTERPADFKVTQVTVWQEPTKIDMPDGFSGATCAMRAMYVQDTSNLRAYDWQGIYRLDDGLNMWVMSERIIGAGAPVEDIQFVRDSVKDMMINAPK